jgi:P27 family predicted phage terminase small subunit
VLREYVSWVVIADRAHRVVAQTGVLVKDSVSGKPSANPAVNVAEKASARLTILAREIGLTPSSRASLRRSAAGTAPVIETPTALPGASLLS